MAEFGIMGVLTELAHDTGISIPSAGNMISFYAFGVVIGAPIVALFSSKFFAENNAAVSGGDVRRW
ncbi:Protein AraJ precursor [Enterobacter hormaechei]|nr:Protein AraJ precursor [Enterobacter hormaechei]